MNIYKLLENYRNKIDIIDNEIFNLINKRFEITKKIGIIKKNNNIPFYIEEREKNIINRLINNNYKNISNEFIFKIIKNIIYESYIKEIYINNNNNNKNKDIKIVFIGGNGKMGTIFKNMFIKYNYNVSNINSKDWINYENILLNSNLIFICSPISKIDFVLEKINKKISSECILLDISSIKKNSMKKMLDIHKGPVLGLHPMFGPNIKNFIKQTIIYSHGRLKSKYMWILNQFKLWGINTINLNSNEHDYYMFYIQILRYFDLLILGTFLIKKKIDLNKLFNLSSPIYKIYLSILFKFFNGDINLYLDIILSSKKNISNIEDFVNYIYNFKKILNKNNKKDIYNIFIETKKLLHVDNKNLSEINDYLSESIINKF